jgi:hypothetical protein
MAGFHLARSCRPLHALELKREGETFSEDQEAFQEWAIARGVPHSVARTLDQASDVLGAWGCLRVKISRTARPGEAV